ncbi:MAG: amidohydrolase [Candidatus Glassbacteria bacterium]|nr:amidohydrolase [Candidatus Glassbacteria bacterium]
MLSDRLKKRLGACSGLLLLPVLTLVLAAGCAGPGVRGQVADAVYYNGKILTVDSGFSVARAVAVKDGRFLAVGSDEQVLKLAGPRTGKIDLGGRTAVPGLIEAHAHPERASLSEAEGTFPNPRTLGQLLDWIREQAQRKPAGEWIIHPKMFATRLLEMRAPTLWELDSVAPENPVFLNGSYGGSINSAAMRASGITGQTRHPGLLRDKATGRLNGLLRYTAFGLLKRPPAPSYTLEQRAGALADMFTLYNKVGFTGVTSGGASVADTALYRYMQKKGMLTLRAFLNIMVDFPFKDMSDEEIGRAIDSLGVTTGDGDEWVRIGALKTMIDGGILTGTAYLREPWGTKAQEIFGITDPDYRGLPRMTAGELEPLVTAGAERGWKMTAHCTGGGGVDLMLDAFEAAGRKVDVPPLRFSIIHGNFFTPLSMQRCRALGVIADAQPAWFYEDADAMLQILGPERIRTFHPYRSLLESGVVVSAGSDHMVRLDDKESINPYSPWLAIWSMVTRKTRRGTVILPEEAITREQALRCYTINNAYASFEEDLKGSIEPGKLADMVVLEKDYLGCPADSLKDMKVAMTVLGGKVVYRK